MTIDNFQPQDVLWCDVCRAHKQGCCDGCGRKFENEAQYKSQSHHFHPIHLNGQSGSAGINKILCVDCYRLDFAAVYPNEKVPPLPDRPGAAKVPPSKAGPATHVPAPEIAKASPASQAPPHKQ